MILYIMYISFTYTFCCLRAFAVFSTRADAIAYVNEMVKMDEIGVRL